MTAARARSAAALAFLALACSPIASEPLTLDEWAAAFCAIHHDVGAATANLSPFDLDAAPAIATTYRDAAERARELEAPADAIAVSDAWAIFADRYAAAIHQYVEDAADPRNADDLLAIEGDLAAGFTAAQELWERNAADIDPDVAAALDTVARCG